MKSHHNTGFSYRTIMHADLLRDIGPGYVPDLSGHAGRVR
jgi:hypothetical protein